MKNRDAKSLFFYSEIMMELPTIFVYYTKFYEFLNFN